jgi:hypothetical protein
MDAGIPAYRLERLASRGPGVVRVDGTAVRNAPVRAQLASRMSTTKTRVSLPLIPPEGLPWAP